MTLHCQCWKDGEPCCWCLDDTPDESATHPACDPARPAVDCVTDMRERVRVAEDELFEAERKKRDAVEVKQ